MTPQYTRIMPTKPSLDEDDLLQPLQDIPSNLDLVLDGSTRRYLSPNPAGTRNGRYVSPAPSKQVDVSLLDPEAFRRLSLSNISSFGREPRGGSPFPGGDGGAEPRAWRASAGRFWERNQGLFLVTISQLFGALMNVTTRLLELEGDGVHPFQVLFARMSITMILCGVWMWWKRIPDYPLGAKGVRLLLLARGLTGFFGIFGIYYSLQYLPVADAVVLTFLAPSVASYACYLFLKEPFPRSAQYASLISLLGVVLIARPVGFFTTPSSAEAESMRSNTTTPMGTGMDADFPVATSAQRLSAVAVAMLGVIGGAGAFTAIRWTGARAHPLLSVNYFATCCTIVSTAALSLAKPLHLSQTLGFTLSFSPRQWFMLMTLALCGFIMQFLFTKGLAVGGKGNSARATNMVYTSMLFALALDKLVFGQSPGWWSLAGSVLILGSAVFVAVQEQEGGADGVRGEDEEMELGNGGAEETMAMLGGGDARGEEGVEEEVE